MYVRHARAAAPSTEGLLTRCYAVPLHIDVLVDHWAGVWDPSSAEGARLLAAAGGGEAAGHACHGARVARPLPGAEAVIAHAAVGGGRDVDTGTGWARDVLRRGVVAHHRSCDGREEGHRVMDARRLEKESAGTQAQTLPHTQEARRSVRMT